MFEGLLLPWQQIYHLAFYSISEQLLEFLVNFTLFKYVKSQRNYGLLITKMLIFGFQIFDLKDHFSASLKHMMPGFHKANFDHDSDQFCVKTKRLVRGMSASLL